MVDNLACRRFLSRSRGQTKRLAVNHGVQRDLDLETQENRVLAAHSLDDGADLGREVHAYRQHHTIGHCCHLAGILRILEIGQKLTQQAWDGKEQKRPDGSENDDGDQLARIHLDDCPEERDSLGLVGPEPLQVMAPLLVQDGQGVLCLEELWQLVGNVFLSNGSFDRQGDNRLEKMENTAGKDVGLVVGACPALFLDGRR